MRLFPKQSYDIGEYVAYDVTASYLGKSRTYRALALFHNLYVSSQNLEPVFWDNIAGTGGILTDVRNERRPLVGDKEKVAAPGVNRVRPNGNHSAAFKIVAANWNRLVPQPLPDFDTPDTSATDTDTSPVYTDGEEKQDTTEHTGSNSHHSLCKYDASKLHGQDEWHFHLRDRQQNHVLQSRP